VVGGDSLHRNRRRLRWRDRGAGTAGYAEAPTFPGNAKATGYWFPRSERSLATAIFDAAAKFSNLVEAPLVALSVIHFGWRGAFWATAALSLVYFPASLFLPRPQRGPTSELRGA
jgi:MFS transporter, ACS family, D-galactonate transporter